MTHMTYCPCRMCWYRSGTHIPCHWCLLDARELARERDEADAFYAELAARLADRSPA